MKNRLVHDNKMTAWKCDLPGFEWLIHQVWYLAVEEPPKQNDGPYLIPNPRAHMLFTPDAQAYKYEAKERVLSGQGSHLLTANDQILRLEEQYPLKRIGLTFRPEGLYVLNSSAVESRNQCEWFTWLDERFDASFRESLWALDVGSLSFQSQLLSRLSEHFEAIGLTPPEDKAWHLAHQVVSKIEQQPNEVHDINSLSEHFACSRRTLERAFKQVVGLSLKQYLQLHRLDQMVLALYAQGNEINWADFSADFGFSDQSHLIRTLKQQLQQTPASYIKSRNLTIDLYGDFET